MPAPSQNCSLHTYLRFAGAKKTKKQNIVSKIKQVVTDQKTGRRVCNVAETTVQLQSPESPCGTGAKQGLEVEDGPLWVCAENQSLPSEPEEAKPHKRTSWGVGERERRSKTLWFFIYFQAPK